MKPGQPAVACEPLGVNSGSNMLRDKGSAELSDTSLLAAGGIFLCPDYR